MHFVFDVWPSGSQQIVTRKSKGWCVRVDVRQVDPWEARGRQLLSRSNRDGSFVNQQSSDKAEESEQVKTECRYTMWESL